MSDAKNTPPAAGSPGADGSVDLLDRLISYRETMAPHQRQRMSGQLFCEAIQEIERLRKAIHETRPADDVANEIRDAWQAARGAGGQMQAFRILERMVDRLGYGRTENNPPLLPNTD